MTNPVQRAFNVSRKAHTNLAGVKITIGRGLDSSPVRVATVGFSGDTTYDSEGAALYTRHRDYLINVDQYDLGSGALTPARFDTITEVINGVPTVFQVVNTSNDNVAVHDDTDRTFWRVHTKEVL